jgi:single-strand DNA-binding protein
VANINRVTITGNLTRDPEVRNLPSGTTVCELGVAVNHRRKDNQTDQWVEEPNYFNVVVFGAQGDSCAQYLSKGRPVAVDGRLRWSSWEDKNGGGKRSKVEIVAQTVQFLGSRGDDNQGGGNFGGGGQQQSNQGFSPASDVPADTSDFGEPAGVGSGGGGGGSDDDIPF